MEKTASSKWVQFTPDKELAVRFLEEKATHDSVHWVAGNNQLCQGKGCRFCNVGMKKRSRIHIDVELEGERKVLTLPVRAYDEMIHDWIHPDPIKGIWMAILPIGTGSGRRYKFRKLDSAPRVAEPRALTTESCSIDSIYAVLVSWEGLALELETTVILLRESLKNMMDVVQFARQSSSEAIERKPANASQESDSPPF